MEVLAKTFLNVHGARLKTAFAEMLISLLHPIGKVSSLLIVAINIFLIAI